MRKRSPKPSKSHVLRSSALLAVWSVLSATLNFSFNQTTSLLTMALYALVIVVSLTNLFPLAKSIILLISSGLIVTVNYNLWGLSQAFYFHTGLAVLAFWIAASLCDIIGKQYHALTEKLLQDRQLMDELIVYDPETNLMHWKFVHKSMDAEIARSRRLETPLSLILIGVPQEKEFPNHTIYHPRDMVAELFFSNFRTEVDIPFMGEEFGVILPETDIISAQIIAWQMVEDISNVLDTDITIGVTSLISKGDTTAALIDRAKSALVNGLKMGQSVVTQQEVSKAPPDEAVQAIADEVTLQRVCEDFTERDSINLLESPVLGSHEWIIWIGGIQDHSKIEWTKTRFQTSETVQFLMLWEQYMVVNLMIGCEETAEFARAFNSWVVKDIDPERHFALLWPG